MYIQFVVIMNGKLKGCSKIHGIPLEDVLTCCHSNIKCKMLLDRMLSHWGMLIPFTLFTFSSGNAI